MDELEGRLDRIYSALDAVRETDFGRFQVVPGQWEGHSTLGVDFRAGLTDEQLANLALIAIHNVAHLEGHLIRWAKSNGSNPALISEAIGRSGALRVIIDLSNNDKHAYPPRNGGRSGRAPRLREVERFMDMRAGAWVGLRFGLDASARPEGKGSVVTALEYARRLAPDNGAVFMKLALLSCQAGDFRGALADCDRALAHLKRLGYIKDLRGSLESLNPSLEAALESMSEGVDELVQALSEIREDCRKRLRA